MTAGQILVLAAVLFPVAVRLAVVIENRLSNSHRQGAQPAR